MSESFTALLLGPELPKQLSTDAAALPSSPSCPISLPSELLLSLLLLLLVPLVLNEGQAEEDSEPSGFGPASEPEPPAAAETLKNAPTYACPLHASPSIQLSSDFIPVSSRQVVTHVNTMEKGLCNVLHLTSSVLAPEAL